MPNVEGILINQSIKIQIKLVIMFREEMMMIEKTAKNRKKNYTPLYFLESARRGEQMILEYFEKKGNYVFLLPAYIGFSANEGSGIFDPVAATGIQHRFYHINRKLGININDLSFNLEQIQGTPIVLLVHYFGYPDKQIEDIVNLCQKHNAIIIEDCAHALYTDYIDHKCGFYGDFTLYSIHKMLPYEDGGFLKINNVKYDFYNTNNCKKQMNTYFNIFNYDFYAISKSRKRNAQLWENLILKSNCSKIEVLKKGITNITPQTYPVLIHDYDRNKLYFSLNDAGFGAVSLYHSMIKPIEKQYEDSVWLSHHIMNLPVHQDTDEKCIRQMFEKMMQILS